MRRPRPGSSEPRRGLTVRPRVCIWHLGLCELAVGRERGLITLTWKTRPAEGESRGFVTRPTCAHCSHGTPQARPGRVRSPRPLCPFLGEFHPGPEFSSPIWFESVLAVGPHRRQMCSSSSFLCFSSLNFSLCSRFVDPHLPTRPRRSSTGTLSLQITGEDHGQLMLNRVI